MTVATELRVKVAEPVPLTKVEDDLNGAEKAGNGTLLRLDQ